MTPRRMVMVAYDDVQILDVCGPLEVFSRAARLVSDEGRRGPLPYRVEIVAPRRGPVRCSNGLELVAAHRFGEVRGPIDTLLVAGGRGAQRAGEDRALVDWLRRASGRARRTASICTGAYILARTGLLDGKRATSHWTACAPMAAQFPQITVESDPIFIRQGRVYTSAGVTAGMDLALALVEEDHGPRVAREAARQLVLFMQRPGGQAQFSSQLAVQLNDHQPLSELTAWMVDHLGADLSVEALARRLAMSPRSFARHFVATFAVTPARYVERIRVEAARRRLVESGDGVAAVAADCGFGTAESMRRAFQRTLRVAPSDYRSRFGERVQ